ncbi:MAG: hypothetical protein NTU85_00570 [Candidatus Kaiserbacteria bacterium]|nr:hypothetical protein [Candidatus Kaiserbacteria bacterium]
MIAIQTNVEYWFRLIYECLHGACYGGTITAAGFSTGLTHIWIWVTNIGYILSIAGLFVIIYTTMRLFELRKREEEYYSTIIPAPGTMNISPRWQHIESLASGASASEWREAIIEADIMLDDLLTQRGFIGEGVGEKLKSVEPADFSTLQDAWEAHKVRNQIAHEGSAFNLSESLAHRTIARYESVFREFKEI